MKYVIFKLGCGTMCAVRTMFVCLFVYISMMPHNSLYLDNMQW